jgi:hypothetical protein
MVRIATALNRFADAAAFAAAHARLVREFHTTWFNATVGSYGLGEMASNALALSLDGVVPPSLRTSVVAALVASIEANGQHVATGIVSTAVLFPVLSRESALLHQIAVNISIATTYPSFGYMFNNPNEVQATTLWERWNSDTHSGSSNSRNHIMFGGGIGSWFWRHVAGINIGGGTDAYDFTISPLLPHTLHAAVGAHAGVKPQPEGLFASHLSRWGRVSVSYTCSRFVDASAEAISSESTGCFAITLSVSIPPNARALIEFPAMPGIHGRTLRRLRAVAQISATGTDATLSPIAVDLASPALVFGSGSRSFLLSFEQE